MIKFVSAFDRLACALLFLQHFLPLASLANLGKAIALAAFVATAPAFQQALCAGNNLADLTAKNQVGGVLQYARTALARGC